MSMPLKEAFRYKNTLSRMFEEVSFFLAHNSSNLGMTVVENHLRRSANPEAEDEIVEVRPEQKFDYPVDLLVDFMLDVADEIRSLMAAVEEAKVGTLLDTDSSCNADLRKISSTLKGLGEKREQEQKSRCTDFKFNAEGNQVPYSYDVITTKTPTYNTARMKKLSRTFRAKADSISERIDRLMVERVVLFEPRFGVSDSLGEALEDYYEGTRTKCAEGDAE